MVLISAPNIPVLISECNKVQYSILALLFY